MKYHSPIKIVITSLIITLTFAFISLLSVYLFSAKTPAEIMLDNALKTISQEKRLNISFSKMDKNVRNHITLNDVEISLDEENIFYSSSITLYSSFLSFVRSLLGGEGTFDITLDETDVSISTAAFDAIKNLMQNKNSGIGASSQNENGNDNNFAFRIRINNLDFNFLSFSLMDAELFSIISTANLLEELDIRLDNISYMQNDLSVDAKSINARLINKRDGTYSFDAGFSTLDLSYKDADVSLERIAINSTLSDFREILNNDVRLSFNSATAAYKDIFYSRIYPSYLRVNNHVFSSEISVIVASYQNYALSLEDLSFAFDSTDNALSLDSVSTTIFRATDPFAEIEELILNVNFNTKDVTSSAKSISTSLINDYVSSINDITFNNMALNFNFLESYDARVNATLSISSEERILDNTTASLFFDLSYKDKIESLRVNMNSIDLPSLSQNMDLNLNYDNGSGYLYFNYANSALLRIDAGDEINISAELRSLNLSTLLPYIHRYIPIIENYIADETTLNGIFNANLVKDESVSLGYRGNVSYAIGLSGIRFSYFTFNAATSLNAELNDDIEISLFNITTDFIRLGFTGRLSSSNFIPYGSLFLESTSSGNRILTLDLMLNSEREYSFDLTFPTFERVRLSGLFNFEDLSHLYSNANLLTRSTSYDFYVDINFNNQEVMIKNDRAEFILSYGDEIVSSLEFDRFMLPHRSSINEGSSINGRADFYFNVTSQEVRLSSDVINIDNLYLLPGNPDLSFSLAMDNSSFKINDILLSSSVFIPLSGNLSYTFSTHSFALNMLSSSENIALSITPFNNYLTGYFRLSNFNAERIGLGNNLINADLMGMGQDFDSLSFSGVFSLETNDPSNPLSAKADVEINSREIIISSFSYEIPSLSLMIDEAVFNTTIGELQVPLRLEYDISNRDRDYPITLDLNAKIDFERKDNLYDFIVDYYRSKFNGLSGEIVLNELNIDNALLSGRKQSAFTYNDNILNLSGDFVAGYYDVTNKSLNLSLDFGEIGKLSLDGSISEIVNIDISIRDLSLYVANLVMVMPVINFSENSLADGDLTLLGPVNDMKIYGYLSSEMIEMEIFWLPDQKVVSHNIFFTVWDNNIESALTSLSVIDSQGRRSNARGRVCFYLSDGLGFDHYTVDVNVDEGDEIDFRFPISSMNVDVKGKVSGSFHLFQRRLESVTLSGDMNILDAELSLGMADLPSWYRTRIKTSYDFNLHLVSNNSFTFPSGPNPIISATAAENQYIRFYTSQNGGFGASGALNLRAGEIYYFQRSFFIREGSINFRENGINSIDPVINLRAELKTFDQDGDPVDIYLVLREADLNNFTPMFESSPAKDLSEIMSILGQSIVNTDSSGTNLGNMVSLLTTGVDVLQRMGIIGQNNSNSLQMSIRNSLNLDTFTLHTNIIGNLVYDAVLTGQNAQRWNISPIARYLDGTALYMGKYITPDLYFEALAHLSAQRRAGEREDYDNVSSFLSSDLFLDIELSLEWENPLCSVTLFTRPQSLTIDSCFKYLGLTFSKRFVF